MLFRSRVLPGDRRRGEGDDALAGPAQNVDARLQRKLAPFEQQQPRGGVASCRASGRGDRVADEGVAVRINRSNEARLGGLVAKRGSQVGDEGRQIVLRDERPRPQTLEDFLFR